MSNPGPSADRRSLLQSSLQAIEVLEAKLAAAERARTEPIAVIGMSCRFPGGVDSPESFWQLLREGRDAVTELPPDRRKIAAAFGVVVDNDPGKPAWRGGFLDQIDRFDPQLFGITPREAQTMDPQQRLVLEVAWEAIERAGYAPDNLAGSRTGVFLGISTNDYGDIVRAQGYANLDAYAATGGSMNVAAGRVSFVLGLQGPAVAVDTACSSSLVAVHLAVQSLRTGESSMALAGGVNVVLMPDGFVSFSSWGMMASDGRCKAFDARADGFVRSEGCGLLVLKRLSDAQADGDPILAVIRGSAVNQDGRSSGLTVPNGRAQQAMLQQALAGTGIEPAEVQYVEAHGTGTALGDPIEVEAIGAVLGKGRGADQPLFLSSVKTNIGHAESAAGIAAVIKVILAMQHGEIPPLLHLQQRSPKITWPPFPIEIPTAPTPWPARDGLRLAGVSGFGFSGTNAHVLLASPPVSIARPSLVPEPRAYRLLTLAAKSEEAVRAGAARLAAHLAAHPELALADVCHTANTGRAQFAHRLAVVAASVEELRSRLDAVAEGGAASGTATGRAPGGRPRVAFLFTGQGAQYAGMGRGLYASQPVFREALDRCAELLAPHLDLPLLELLFGAETDKIDRTAYTQPALFALEYALVELWRSWGVTPSVVIGHSVGEYVAAVVAGVLSLEDGLRLIAARGRLMQSLPAGGAMAAIVAPLDEVQAAVAPHAAVAVAAANGPEHTVISGEETAVAAVMERFGAAGARVQRLVVSHAFHSPLMDPILDEFEGVVASVALRAPGLPLISNLSGAVAGDEVTTPAYWRCHLREAVRFGAGVETLRGLGVDLLVEIGPHPTLLGMAQTAEGAGPAPVGLPSLRRSRDDEQQILESLGQLYVRGGAVNWAALDQGIACRKVVLPTYPFQRSRYWVDLPVLSARRAREQAFGGHPLLGRRTRSPLLRETLFESEVSAVEPAFLADHRVYGATIFPGTAYLELALAAAASVGAYPVRVTNLSIREPLLLDETPYTLQLVLAPDEAAGAYAVQIAGFRADEPEVVHTHATGAVCVGDVGAAPARVDLNALRAGCPEPIDADEFYAALAEKGLGYGPAFRGVSELWRGEGAALGLVRLPEAAGPAEVFQLHPALLDACFHVIGAALPAGDAGVPVAIADLTLFRPAPTAVWCYAERVQSGVASDQALTCRLLLLDEAGEPVAALERLEVLRAPRGAWERDSLAPWFHQIAWRPRPRAADAASAAAGLWLVLADAAGAADDLAAHLAAAGAGVTVALVGASTAEGPARRQVRPDDPRAFDPILAEAGPLSGVVCLWAEPPAPRSLEALQAREELVCAATLHLVQALGRCESDQPRLWIVTRGAQPADPAGAPVEPADATLWGLGKVVALEQPGLRCALVDLDPAADSMAQLADELLAPDGENQLALRGGARLAARLVPRAPVGMALPGAEPYRLTLPQRGQLDRMTYAPLEVREPGPGEVAVTVYATGLNFRDVLNVLGMYPGDPGPPGIECAGVIAAVGAGVTGLAVGDRVVGLAPRSFDAVVITPANLVAPLPAGLGFAEAATVPSAFLTAHYGLRALAALQPGERVLIHAAAGGVGLAAVQIARQIGAEIFATAGSPAKHAFLRTMGVRHIFSSRTADFRERLLELTGGRGVDVVLNSLSDDFISDSFAALAPGGRFLEIGKRGIWTPEQAAAARPDVRYAPYDLGDVLRDEPERIRAMLEEVLAAMGAGELAPLPLRAFSAEGAVDAFRYMSQAKHIGKVVVTHRPAAWQGPAHPDGAYIVTGGLGGLGLRVAGWLVERGARHVALLGRRAPSPEAALAIAALREAGAEVQLLAADVSSQAELARALGAIAATGRPLRGVFHAAGALDDGVLPQQRWERFAGVFAPKVAGAWNLHMATRSAPLDHFVLFSSASALLGNAGQANYAAANAFLDALAHQRRAAGLPAVSVNWGAWAEVGMAAALGAGHQGQIAGRGVELIDPDKGVLALERALANGDAQTAVLPVRWATLLEQFPAGQTPPLFAELARATPARPAPAASGDDAAAFRRRLADASGDERRRLLVERLTLHVARVMGLDPQNTDPARSLSDLGIDSLMAVELKNRIDADLRGSVPVTTLLAGPTIAALADELTARPGDAAEQAAAPAAAGNGHPATAEQLLANLDQLSDDDVDAMLDAMLKDQGDAV